MVEKKVTTGRKSTLTLTGKRIVINGHLPSLNEYITANNRNRFIAAKMKKEATELVAWQVKSCPKITEPSSYTFTWHVTNRRSDPDNIASAVKYIFDGLQVARVLPQDSFKWVLAINHRFVLSKEAKVIVDINP